MTKKLALEYPPPTEGAGFAGRLSRYLSINFRRIEDYVDRMMSRAVFSDVNLTFTVDEGTDTLTITVIYSDGMTVKTVDLSLT